MSAFLEALKGAPSCTAKWLPHSGTAQGLVGGGAQGQHDEPTRGMLRLKRRRVDVDPPGVPTRRRNSRRVQVIFGSMALAPRDVLLMGVPIVSFTSTSFDGNNSCNIGHDGEHAIAERVLNLTGAEWGHSIN